MTILYWKIKDAYGNLVEKEDRMTNNIIEEENLEYFPYSTGYIPDPIDSRDYKLSNIIPLTSSPRKVDYTNEMSPVKNQGNKGACVGFAIAAMIEWQQQKEYLMEKEKGSGYNRKKDHYNLSEQWIYHKAKEIDEYSDDTEGTTLRAGLKTINKYGVPTEKGWEYSDIKIGKPEFWAGSVARWNRSKSYYKIENIAEMEDTLNKIGPFVTGILVYPEMIEPGRNGYVKYPNNPYNYLGGHAICIVAYDKKKKLFKFKNSWGTNWGNRGYGLLSYDYLRYLSIISWVSIDEDIKNLKE